MELGILFLETGALEVNSGRHAAGEAQPLAEAERLHQEDSRSRTATRCYGSGSSITTAALREDGLGFLGAGT